MGQSESSPSQGFVPSGRKEKERDRSRTHSRVSESHDPPPARRVVSRNQTPPFLPNFNPVGTPTTSTSTEQARPRSATSASAPMNMAASESKPRPPSRSSTLNNPPAPTDKRQRSPLSQPVDIPTPSSHDESADRDNFTPESSPFGLPASVFTNPPRLPLPIERDPEPASPIISSEDIDSPSPPNDDADDTYLGKHASLVSSSTLDEDEGADIQQFAMETDPLAPKVPTPITYRGEGKHIYVTGTFASWEKKFRMHREKDGSFKATIPLTPGTHHIVFLVDGDAKTSTELPTTVDFANALVNYIEVAAPDSPELEKQTSPPVPIPGTSPGTVGPGIPLVDDQPIPTAPGTTSNSSATPAVGSPQPGERPSSLRPHSIPGQITPGSEQGPGPPQQRQQKPQLKQAGPRPQYTTEIPQILLHMDLYNTPSDPRYRLASKVVQNLPQPPSLPMFMSKSILNATTPQKDDASVLTMPNHTVLNHLATSSIRQGVLATSGTTRYKRKFLTTIMYKPTSEDG